MEWRLLKSTGMPGAKTWMTLVHPNQLLLKLGELTYIDGAEWLGEVCLGSSRNALSYEPHGGAGLCWCRLGTS